MPRGDPYEPETPLIYECVDCAARVTADSHPGTCEGCGGQFRDVSVPRE